MRMQYMQYSNKKSLTYNSFVIFIHLDSIKQ
jgi:hypothetical protein